MTKEVKIILIISVVIIAGVFWLAVKSTNQQAVPVSSSLLVKDNSHMTGQKNAKVTVVEFGDYQCPACGYAEPIVEQVLADYKSNPDFNFVFRNFPLPMHANAQAAALAAETAVAQGKFWEMHNKIYQAQAQWSDLSDPTDTFAGYAQELGLDVNKFKDSLKKKEFSSAVSDDLSDGQTLGINATPTFYINGIKFETVLSLDKFKAEIDKRLK